MRYKILLFVQSFMDIDYAGKFPGRLNVTFNITCAFPLELFVHTVCRHTESGHVTPE